MAAYEEYLKFSGSGEFAKKNPNLAAGMATGGFSELLRDDSAKKRLQSIMGMGTDILSRDERSQLESERQAVLKRLNKVGQGGGGLGSKADEMRKRALDQYRGQRSAGISNRSKTKGFQERMLGRESGAVSADIARQLAMQDLQLQKQFDLENLQLANQFIQTSGSIEEQRKKIAQQRINALQQELQYVRETRSKAIATQTGAAGNVLGAVFGGIG